ncbi:MAG: ABC transporter permease [Anaerolineales bacterium]
MGSVSRTGKINWIAPLFQVAAFLLALSFTTLILLAVGAPPGQAYLNILRGAFGNANSLANVLVVWAPLLLTTVGVLITFSAGLWNIGVEGQVTLGAIFTTWVLRLLQESALPPWLIIVLAMLGGMLGGALWAALAGVLKTFGGVNEIFGGLGLNFVSTALTLWLIFGPWKRPGTGSMSGTLPFPETLWLPTLSGLRLSPWALGLALLALVAVYFVLRGTRFGLRLKAVGRNMRAAYLLGVPTWQHMMASFLLCGLLAGLAGALQVTAVYHRLIPSISSGYGFLGLLVAMLVNYQAVWAAPVALFFAALNIGSIQLPIVLRLDSSLAGVLQGLLVLFVLLVEGARQQIMKRARLSDETVAVEERP